MYSLVSAPVLGFDLTRREGGAATAGVLLRAFVLTAADLPILAAHLPDEGQRAELWVDVEKAASRLPSVQDLGASADAALTLGIIERAPIGTVDSLLHLLRHEVLEWTWSGAARSARLGNVGAAAARASDPQSAARQSDVGAAATAVLCDAAVGAYLRDALAPLSRRRLGAGWVAAMRRLPEPVPIDLGPHHLVVSALLDRVRTLRVEDAERLIRASDNSRRTGPGAWSGAVHSASWAAYLSDRLRTAAAAQLLLVQALDDGVVPVADRAGGVWNLLSGAVQALVVRDLLDTATSHRLVAPLIGVLGPAWFSADH